MILFHTVLERWHLQFFKIPVFRRDVHYYFYSIKLVPHILCNTHLLKNIMLPDIKCWNLSSRLHPLKIICVRDIAVTLDSIILLIYSRDFSISQLYQIPWKSFTINRIKFLANASYLRQLLTKQLYFCLRLLSS